MRSKKFLSVIFLLSWLAVYCIAGNLEQEYISGGQALVLFALDYAVMAYSGFKSGLLTMPEKGKEPAPSANGTSSK
ncbi:MAG: hypothetical protein NC253_13415 [Ruminococcus sp.]|nr:hypothetical protein [Ruminococcus sp.]MCM1381376.1 hypothetical protein [Muribaculaceae bacterium]